MCPGASTVAKGPRSQGCLHSNCSFATCYLYFTPIISRHFPESRKRFSCSSYFHSHRHCVSAKRQANVKSAFSDFPARLVAKDPPANLGNMGLIPGLGRFHMPWDNWAMYHNYSAHALKPVLNKRNHCKEKPVLESNTCLPQPEKGWSNEDPEWPKRNKQIKI